MDGYINNQDSNWPIITNNTPRDWSLIRWVFIGKPVGGGVRGLRVEGGGEVGRGWGRVGHLGHAGGGFV